MTPDREPSRLDLRSGRLRLAALRVPAADVVAVRAWLRGGARRERSPGLSLLTGRMLVEGTASRTWREIAEEAEARGVAIDGSATAEVHGLSIDALASDAGLALDWLAELLLSPTFPRDRFDLLRDQTLGDLLSLADRPEVVTGWAFRDQLYHPHPLAAPSQGTPESLAGLSPEDCRRFHEDALARGGVIAVAGAIDEREVLARLERLFGSSRPATAPSAGLAALSAGLAALSAGPAALSAGPAAPAAGPADPFAGPAAPSASPAEADEPPPSLGRPERRIEVATTSREQAHVYAGHFTVNRTHPDLPELRALGILLGSDGLAGLIPNRVREQEGLAYAAHVDLLAGAGTDPGALSVYLGTHPDRVERGLELVRDSLAQVLKKPPEGAALDDCKTGMFGREPFATETAALQAGLLVDSMLHDLPSHRRSWRLERIARLTPAGVFEAARRHLCPDGLRVTVGLPGRDGGLDLPSKAGRPDLHG